jgi:segregation and condensation protein A
MDDRTRNGQVEPAAVVFEDGASTLLDPQTATTAESGEGPAGTGYRVQLEKFEGPLDLLLFLIKRDEIEITDIPIAHITEQYLASIREVEELDLDRAGEFLLMAATLMRIKAKMLLPPPIDEETDEEEVDPREELMKRLLEYREFKKIGELLGDKEEEWRKIFRRDPSPLPEIEAPSNGYGVSLLDLFRAFHRVIESMPSSDPFELVAEEYSVDEQIELIRRECFVTKDGVPFTSLFPTRRSRALVITTFLALLELVRRGEVLAVQLDEFGEIWLKQKEELTSHAL